MAILPLAYSVSEQLSKTLSACDTLRKQILLSPISPKIELRLRWEATIGQTFWSLTLSANPLTKNEMGKILSNGNTTKKMPSERRGVYNYREALNYISQEWLVSTKGVSLNTLNTLFDISCNGIYKKSSNQVAKHKKELQTLFDYLNASTEHPVIKAAIAQIQLIQIAPFKEGNGRIARLIAYLYLYKDGYDCRGLLVFDEYLRRDLVALKQTLDHVAKTKTLTVWIEYFALGIARQLANALETIQNNKFSTDLSASFWKLSIRQKRILSLLDEPGSKVTNKEVQKQFKVSQITASRDLSKLASLNLIFPHGKGRAVHYTKA